VNKQVDKLQQENKEKHRIILQTAIDGFWMFDIQGRLLEVNEAYCKMSGYSVQELLTMRIPDLEAAEVAGETTAHIQKILEKGEDRFETRHRRKDGSNFDVAVGVQYQPEEGGRFIAFLQDISERKKAEKEIQSLARFPFENPNPTLRITKDGMLVSINPSGKILLPDWHLVEGQAVPPLLKKAVSQSIKEGKPQLLDLVHGKRVYSFFISPVADSGYTNIYGRDITEQKQNQIELLNSVNKLRRTMEGSIETIALIVEARDPYTSGHQKRVAEISVAIAKDLGLTENQIQGIYMTSLIHDLGKIQVPAEILSKPGKLTKLEFDMIKTHPKVGFDLLKRIEFPWPLAQIIYQHHERMNGSGYPRKLKGDKILLEARIIGIADVIEAMSSHRPYRPALGINAALDEIEKHKGTLYDTTIVASFMKVIKKGYKFSK